jgi:hypothetical protein
VKKIILAIILTFELCATGYLALVSWLWSVWMVDDSRAFAMTTIDWYRSGFFRFFEGAVLAALFGVGTFYLNGLLMKKFDPRPLFRPAVSAGFAVVILVASLAGAIEFILTKPYM